ncbi:HK97-gp10 family putative phage morphogenesis protein [Bacillus pseudomycoides]|uniref:HK97-gp10 family putative phage morphogenesis protein n=1 Tax=Bacillus bingmayongensis TaxID=1150157 RepID=A0ABU5K1J1_9BACI|nr:HK97-gp10 family putative phage morphogenesis protein [Bacillus pseudomycoides]
MAQLEVFGIEEWIQELESWGQDVPKITTKALKAGANVFKDKLEAPPTPVGPSPKKPTAKQPWWDGKHAKDAVQIGKIVKRGGASYVQIGWDKADRSPHFYMKFQNWGTSKKPNPPHKGFVEKTMVQSQKEVLEAMQKVFMDAMPR